MKPCRRRPSAFGVSIFIALLLLLPFMEVKSVHLLAFLDSIQRVVDVASGLAGASLLREHQVFSGMSPPLGVAH